MSPQDRARWTNDAVSHLRPEELARLRQDSFFGTGFLVSIPESRLGNDQMFNYVVTNRHVVQPGIEEGRPCKVVNYAFSLNHLENAGPSPGSSLHLVSIPANPEHFWTFPDDDSVDLAAAPFAIQPTDFDYKTIPLDLFVTQEMIEKNEVVEGDPVMFTGLFIQYSGGNKLEPVVRSGTIAMLPSDLTPTTLV
jgi:hypothetical protein